MNVNGKMNGNNNDDHNKYAIKFHVFYLDSRFYLYNNRWDVDEKMAVNGH